MPTILDIDENALRVTIKIRGGEFDIWPISTDDLFWLSGKYPVIGVMLGANMAAAPVKDPAVMADLISCSQRASDGKKLRGDEAIVAKVSKFSASDQVKAVEEIFKISFEEGVVSFAEALAKLTGGSPRGGAASASGSESSKISPNALQTDGPLPMPARFRQKPLPPSGPPAKSSDAAA